MPCVSLALCLPVKPLARQEPVSEEQSIAATFTRHIDQAISLGDFTKIRKWLDNMIENIGDKTKNRIARLKVSAVEKVLHRKLLQGDKATIKALFDSYIDKDIAGVKKYHHQHFQCYHGFKMLSRIIRSENI